MDMDMDMDMGDVRDGRWGRRVWCVSRCMYY
jgi:hypothetical protein